VYLSNGTATSPGDYDSTPVTVSFANGETSKTIAIPLVNDSTFEGNETVNLLLSSPTGGASIGTQNTATLTIIDNDPPVPGTLAFSNATFSVNEDGTSVAAVTVTRTGGSDGAVSAIVSLTDGSATSPADYDSTPIVVSFANGEISKTISIPIVDDAAFEGNETINLVLGNPTGGATLGEQSTATLNIINNDVALPDLVVTAATAPTSASLGETVDLTWAVTNQGIGNTSTGWTDYVYLSDDTILDSSDIFLTAQSVLPQTPLSPDNNYTVTQNAAIPATALGNRYLLFSTDTNNSQSETDETNNVRAVPIQLSGPDLAVTNIVAPVEGLAGQQIEIAWTVTNQGNREATGTWTDILYLSSDQEIGTDQFLGSFSFTGTIGAGESIVRRQLVTLPTDLSGDRWVTVQTNAGNQIAEASNGNNTTLDDRVIAISLPPAPNLQVSSITAPPNAFSGKQTVIEWTVTNTGTGATNAPVWSDGVWLSLDNTFDNTDIFLGSVTNPSYLNVGESYTTSLTAILPEGISNDYRFIVKADYSNRVEELGNEADNLAVSTPTDVQLSPLPDLEVTTANAPAQAFSGQSFSLTWTVTNQGLGRTAASTWYDAVYMSTDTTLDNKTSY
jgi:subtilase family serine protease